jgi:octaprenyl-diphosphate synthase
MKLEQIYRPIHNELKEVNEILLKLLKNSRSKSVKKLNGYLLNSTGKRIRPALLILSARIASGAEVKFSQQELIKAASAIELIHMASLIHDDVIDQAHWRRHKPTLNQLIGNELAISLGDYLYALSFELISELHNRKILHCISSTARAMSEGELLQVSERRNFNLSKDKYILIIKKKTASLFSASCEIGALISNAERDSLISLKGYGLNFGIAYQLMDDYLDITGEKVLLGKEPGQDIKAGELTLPILNLLERLSEKKKTELKSLLESKRNGKALDRIKDMLFSLGIDNRTRSIVLSFLESAKNKVDRFSPSPFKNSLIRLADFVFRRGFDKEGIEFNDAGR